MRDKAFTFFVLPSAGVPGGSRLSGSGMSGGSRLSGVRVFWGGCLPSVCILIAMLLIGCAGGGVERIDRVALLERNNPRVTAPDSLASLSVGNGDFALTTDVTGLQTFPEYYSKGVPLGTESSWGWHSFANPEDYRPEEYLRAHDFGRGHEELYAAQFKEPGRQRGASEWYRANPHRLHLGCLGLELGEGVGIEDLKDVEHELHLMEGRITSRFSIGGEGVGSEAAGSEAAEIQTVQMQTVEVQTVEVQTVCHPTLDLIATEVSCARPALKLRFPYPTGGHSDDACRWDAAGLHRTELVSCSQTGKQAASQAGSQAGDQAGSVVERSTDSAGTDSAGADSAGGDIRGGRALLRRTLDATTYYVALTWEGGDAVLAEKAPNYWTLTAAEGVGSLRVTCQWLPAEAVASAELGGVQDGGTVAAANPTAGANSADETPTVAETFAASAEHWRAFWMEGAAVDFSHCTDLRAKELERRVVLSQYLLAIQSAGSIPPQETGLTYNSWFGKFHMEMIWWHEAWLALWGHEDMLERTLRWYETVEPVAREIARRQGFDGVRWMKMTDPSGGEAPSNVGSFLIWQQPHLIYLAELVYRANPSQEVLDRYAHLVNETAKFMYSFATYDALDGRYLLKGCIPAQETLKAATTINPPFELSYWHFGMQTAQLWLERTTGRRNLEWDELIDKLSPLAYNDDELYLASEDALDTYIDIRFTSDHMAVLGSVGILPMNKLIRADYMRNTLGWIWDNWNWGKTWGWDYPMTAMNATRLGEPEKAVGALLMNKRTNTYLPNGHNYQDQRLRCYLPGNGGLLTAIALMCAGYDGCETACPGFPKDGTWDVRWEGLKAMP